MSRIVVAGGTGFLGRALAKALLEESHEVVLLSRGSAVLQGAAIQNWDGRTLGPWTDSLDGADAVINLAGLPISMPWTVENRKALLDSRVESSLVIGKAIGSSANPPRTWINGSATGFYGDRFDEVLDETKSRGAGFLSDIAAVWEDAAMSAPLAHTRRVLLRTGVALGREGGAFVPLGRFTKAFLGGPVGHGRQWVSWIHVNDWVELVLSLLNSEISGPVNAVSPNPVRNAELMARFREAFRRPWSPPVPKIGLSIASMFGGPDPSILLDSTRAFPQAAIDDHFEFRFPTIESALLALTQPSADPISKELDVSLKP